MGRRAVLCYGRHKGVAQNERARVMWGLVFGGTYHAAILVHDFEPQPKEVRLRRGVPATLISGRKGACACFSHAKTCQAIVFWTRSFGGTVGEKRGRIRKRGSSVGNDLTLEEY